MPLKFELCPGRVIGGSNPCFIIAEIGQNHQGDIEIAKKMIKMAKSMETMRRVYEIVKEHNQNFCILQCTSAYPLEPEDVNLRVIMEYQKEFPDIPIGYSGHESGISITVGAVALGAKVVERHVTLDKTWKGSDHAASLEPAELAELVRSIRIVEKALGTGVKRMLPCEVPCHDKVQEELRAKILSFPFHFMFTCHVKLRC
uniref:N-acetylneuraminic acid synthase a n=1 Tax=Cyprinus carpio TaxID=7962 RepID=A0A8C1Z699_CYPCA